MREIIEKLKREIRKLKKQNRDLKKWKGYVIDNPKSVTTTLNGHRKFVKWEEF